MTNALIKSEKLIKNVSQLYSPGALVNIQEEIRKRDLNTWLKHSTPTFEWDWPHLLHVQDKLTQISNGTLKRLIIMMPPRHGKSQLTSARFPVWYMMNNPEASVIMASYGATLSKRFSRTARGLAGEYIGAHPEKWESSEWETSAGGSFLAVGVGGGITGHGANLALIDDPIKSRAEANSPTYRQNTWEWYTDDLRTRLEPDAAIVLILTRWHEDDLAGRILASEAGHEWDIVRLPAIAESDKDRLEFARMIGREPEIGDALGRLEGEALCPARYPLTALDSTKREIGSRTFISLYQQSPRPLEGGQFKRKWFIDNMIDMSDLPKELGRSIRYWDKAATDGGGAYTAGVWMARVKDIYYVIDVKREQLSTFKREQLISDAAEIDGPRVVVGMEIEPGSGGKDSHLITAKNISNRKIYGENPTGDKSTRAEPFEAKCEAGLVKFVRGPWNQQYIDEAVSFPNGLYKDQIDASSGGFNYLAKKGKKLGLG